MVKISNRYFDFLCDDFGIWQHSHGNKIDNRHGYALDDCARALVLSVKLKDKPKINMFQNYIISSILDHNTIVNFFDKQRRPVYEKGWSEDALGEAIWGLAVSSNKNPDKRLKEALNKGILTAKEFKNIRGIAYTMLGITNISIDDTIYFSEKLLSIFETNKSEEWPWPENHLTYANALIPWAMIKSYNKMKNKKYLNAGLIMLNFLNNETKINNIPITIGNKGWYQKGKEKVLFDQQPIDIAYQVLANIEAFKATNNNKYIKEAKTYFSWFWGNNLNNKSLIYLKRQTCSDGLHKNSIDKNSGAETIICFLLAQEEIWPYL